VYLELLVLKTYALHQSARNTKSACHLSVPQLMFTIVVTPVQNQQVKLESRAETFVGPHATCRLQLRDCDQQWLFFAAPEFQQNSSDIKLNGSHAIYRPTLVHCTVYTKSHPGFRSDAFRCLLTLPLDRPVCHFFANTQNDKQLLTDRYFQSHICN
jgi:hypothetical protein